MRKVLTGTIGASPGTYGTVSVNVGALSADEVRYFSGASVDIRRVDTERTLLHELAAEISSCVDRSVFSAVRNERIKEILERAKVKGFLS